MVVLALIFYLICFLICMFGFIIVDKKGACLFNNENEVYENLSDYVVMGLTWPACLVVLVFCFLWEKFKILIVFLSEMIWLIVGNQEAKEEDTSPFYEDVYDKWLKEEIYNEY